MNSSWPPRDPQEIIEAVRADVLAKVGAFFDPSAESGSFAFEGDSLDEIVMYSANAVSVGWTFTGTHSARFVGIEPTGLPVTVVGLTMLHGNDDQPMVRRYIDWHDVLGQLGSLPGRTAPTAVGDKTARQRDQIRHEIRPLGDLPPELDLSALEERRSCFETPV